MAAASAIALAAAFNTVDPRAHPAAVRGLDLNNRRGSTVTTTDPSGHPITIPTAFPSPPDRYEALLGRRLAPTPAQLADRILYVPSHNDKATHLPVYDFTAEFREAVRGEPIGSSRFKTSFGLMPKPVGDGRGSSVVSYLVDFEPLEARRPPAGQVGPPAGVQGQQQQRRKSSLGLVVTRASVQRRMLFGGGAEVGLTIPPHPFPGAVVEEGAVACTMTPCSTTTDIPVTTSFPLAPTISKFGSSRNAWFTFTIPSLLDDERTLQWQVHPVEHGLLRYALVELPLGTPATSPINAEHAGGKPPFSATEEENQHRIRAIYHNVGLGFSFSQPFSEGALLLQNDLDAEVEALIVASLLGILWRVRNEESNPRKYSKSDTSGKPARKGSVDEGEVSPTSPGKKRLLSKILRKK